MEAFWIDSHNLTQLTQLKDARTSVLFTDETISSITGTLFDADGNQIGDDIAFSYDEPGECHAVWMREMTENATYKLHILVLAPGLQLTLMQRLPARYKGATQ